MPTTFIALQCCQCSTMQVKQQKKSSNKWNCVVCNQKQSVRRVFAQGLMAKDVRKFVQSFNMSRQLAEQNPLLEDDNEETLEIEDDFPSNSKQKRTDWSEYIDPADEDFKSYDIDEKLGDEFEPKIVTEMPKAVFKKPKLKNYSATCNTAADVETEKPFMPKAVFKKPKLKNYSATCNTAADVETEKPFMPAFGKRNIKSKNTAQAPESSRWLGRMVGGNPEWRENAAEITDRFAEAKELQPTYGTSKWKSFSTQEEDDKFENKGPWRNQSATAKSASKWTCYITEDGDDLLPASGEDLKVQADQRVEEDIHPDFL